MTSHVRFDNNTRNVATRTCTAAPQCKGDRCFPVTLTLDAPDAVLARPASQQTIAVIGAGNSARALAAYLSAQGHVVHMLVRDLSRTGSLAATRQVRASGGVQGTFDLQSVTTDWKAVTHCDTVFIATVTTAYGEVIRRLAPHLRAGQTLILFSSKLAGSVEAQRILDEMQASRVAVVETDALFACRIQPDDSVWIRGVKGWTLYSAPQAGRTVADGRQLLAFFPRLEPARNVLQRGLTDFGALCHPTIMLANLNTIDRKSPFRFYYEGLTDRTVCLLEQMESEFQLLARAYDTPLIDMTELLHRYYGCNRSSLLAAIQSVPNYRHSLAPDTLSHRYLLEDVPNTLVPLYELSRLAGLRTPMIDAAVNIASIVTGIDFLRTGRTLAALGLDGMSASGIVEWMLA
ncbi:MAG: NAD/NADP octopine/nopaline dehydrogenase [Proteobacteria bacterium]|nr:NAD/NADP octopine/nopaline dehydrogenase [Pseudomonadota bacterium]